jgi:hypothetical protein
VTRDSGDHKADVHSSRATLLAFALHTDNADRRLSLGGPGFELWNCRTLLSSARNRAKNTTSNDRTKSIVRLGIYRKHKRNYKSVMVRGDSSPMEARRLAFDCFGGTGAIVIPPDGCRMTDSYSQLWT